MKRPQSYKRGHFSEKYLMVEGRGVLAERIHI